MPYLVVCPNCATNLKSPTPLAAGRVLNCPTCKGQFTLSEPAVPLDTTGRPVGPAPAAPATPTAPPAPAARPPVMGKLESPRPAPPVRRSPPDDIPDAEILDDDDDQPSPRRQQDDDEDDRPRSRRRDPDDEDDRPRPRRGSRDDGDEDDDRNVPRRSRGDDSSDALEVPPPRRRRKKKANKGLLIGLIAGGAALFLCGGLATLLYVFDPFGLFGGASSEMLAWAPADANSVMYLDVDEVNRVEELKSELKARTSDAAKYGIAADNVSAVLGAGRGGGGGLPGEPDVLVIKLKSPADQPTLIATNGGQAMTAGGKTYYKTRTGGGLYFPSGKLVVITQQESTLSALLTKGGGRSALSDGLRAAVDRSDGMVWIATTGTMDFIGMIVGLADPFGPGFAKGPSVTARWSRMSLKASGGTGTVVFESAYDTSETAGRRAEELRRAVDKGRAKVEPGTTFDVSSSGATVTLRVSGPIQKGKGPFPFGFGGP